MTSSDTPTRAAAVAFAFAFAFAFAASAGAAGVSPGDTSASTVAAQDATRIDGCTTIDDPGTYVLTSDVENGGQTPISEACIEITADGVTFDGGGHTVDGRGESHTKGVAVLGARDVEIRNVAVDEWHEGILVEDGSATVREVNASENAYGVRLLNASGTTVENNAVADNLVGISVESANVTLADNDFSENEIDTEGADEPTTRGSPMQVPRSTAFAVRA